MNELEEFLGQVQRAPLMPVVTPLHRLYRLEQEARHEKIYCKRDDMTGIGTGGNKIRSLEYILGEAMAGGCDKIIVSGPGQSNLCMLTAAACAKVGLSCEVVHNSEKPAIYQGNLLLNHILGVNSHFIGAVDSDTRSEYVEDLYKKLEAQGYKPYIVRNGATTGRGALGYAAAALEMRNQCREQGIDELTVFVPGGNGGVATGLIYGNTLLGLPFKIVVVSVEDDAPTLKAHIESTMEELEQITGISACASVDETCVIDPHYRGGGWGLNTEESEKAVMDFARTEGIFIENVYNSKVLVGMKRWIQEKKVKGNVCYLHTGGLGSLFAQF